MERKYLVLFGDGEIFPKKFVKPKIDFLTVTVTLTIFNQYLL